MPIDREHFTIVNTVGAIYFGISFALILGGVAFQQAIIYFSTFRRDKRRIKCMVAILTLLNLCDCACIINIYYQWGLESWGNTDKLERLPTTDGINFIIGGSVTLIVEGFYAYRIYVLNKQWLIACLAIIALAITQFGLLLSAAIDGFIKNLPRSFGQGIVYAWFICVLVGDMFIVTAVTLYCQKAKGLISRETSLYNRMSMLFIQSNFLTGIFVIACGVCIIELENQFYGRPSSEEETFIHVYAPQNSHFSAGERKPSSATLVSPPQSPRLQNHLKDCQPTVPEETMHIAGRRTISEPPRISRANQSTNLHGIAKQTHSY